MATEQPSIVPDAWMCFLEEKTKIIFVPPSFFLSVTLTKTPFQPRGRCCLFAMEGDVLRQLFIPPISLLAELYWNMKKDPWPVCILKPSKRGWYQWWFLSVALHIGIAWNPSVRIERKSLSSLFGSQWNGCLPDLTHLFMRLYFCLPMPTPHAWPTRWACAPAPAFSPARFLSLVYLAPHARWFSKSPMNLNYSPKL